MSTFCAACGNSLSAEDRFCRICGRAVDALSPSIPSAPAYSGPSETSGKAVASLIFGLLFFVPLAFLVAVVFGHLALSDIKKSAGRLKGQGLAITGLVLGYCWIAILPILLIIAAIAIPNLLHARIQANELGAMTQVRILVTAETAYAASHPETGFTCSLSELGTTEKVSGLVNGQHHGYQFELQNCRPGAAGANEGFQVLAYPLVPNQTGVRSFCSDESGLVKAIKGASTESCIRDGTPASQNAP